jgi:hypothetical protein
MAFSLDPISLGIGALIVAAVVLLVYLLKGFKKKKNKTSLPTMKSYVKEAHNHMVDATNNLIKLYEVFNEIDEKPQA